MAERHNTVVCSFDPSNPRIRWVDEWIYASVRLLEPKATIIQIGGIKRQVYIKIVDRDSVLAILRETGGQAEYKYPTGGLSIVSLAMAGMGTKRFRIVNLPLEVPKETLRATLAPFRKVLDIQVGMWSKAYRYSMAKGVRQVMVMLTRHVTSHLTVTGRKVLLSYEWHPANCYGCGEIGHMYQGCPARQRSELVRPNAANATYASIVSAPVHHR